MAEIKDISVAKIKKAAKSAGLELRETRIGKERYTLFDPYAKNYIMRSNHTHVLYTYLLGYRDGKGVGYSECKANFTIAFDRISEGK